MESFPYKRKSVNYAFFFFIVALIVLGSLIFADFYLEKKNRPQNILQRAEKVFLEKENKCLKESRDIIYRKDLWEIITGKRGFPGGLPNLNKNGVAIQCFLKDSLVLWSDHSVSELNKNQIANSQSLQKLGNGWFYVKIFNRDSITLAWLILIRYDYAFENEFLANRFQRDFKIDPSVEISAPNGHDVIYSISGAPVMSLDFGNFRHSMNSMQGILFIVLAVFFLLLEKGFYHSYNSITLTRKYRLLFVLFFSGDLIIIRIIQAWLKFPRQLYCSSLFAPEIYSSTFFLPSAGDYFLNSLIILFISFAFFKKFNTVKIFTKFPVSLKNLTAYLFFVLIMFLYIALISIFRDLVMNSSFSVDLKDISKFNWYSIVGISIMYMLSLSFFFLTIPFSKFFRNEIKRFGPTCIILLISLSAYVVLSRFFLDRKTILISGLLLLTYYFLLLSTDDQEKNWPLRKSILPFIWLAVTAGIILNMKTYQREQEERKLLAVRLASEKNPLTEMMFSQLERKVREDTTIQLLIKEKKPGFEIQIQKYLKSQYIKDFWNRFSTQITVCQQGKMLKIQPKGFIFGCDQYFRSVSERFGKNTGNQNLWSLDYGSASENYVALISLEGINETHGKEKINIWFELNAKTPSLDLGYPELLIDKRIINFPDLGNYSYAIYQRGTLVYRAGKYDYRMLLSREVPSNFPSSFFNSNGMSHYFYSIDKTKILIISKNSDSLLAQVSPVSYIFLIFYVFTLILNFFFWLFLKKKNSWLNLRSKILAANAGIIIVSFLILGFLVIYFMIRMNNLKNINAFRERAISVMTSLQDSYSGIDKINREETDSLENDILKLSTLFFTDVNIYSPDGRILLSSRPQIFDEGLISGRMNYTQMNILKNWGEPLGFTNENIGSYTFISAYFPLFNEKNKLLAYVNLPFFSRQEDLKKEVSEFLVAFMNLYVLFILLSIFISFIISKYVSSPLNILSARMARIQLGKSNARIEWKHEDEIGHLVIEYNRMIDELEKSAEQLAKSERESAWREMARQVAHEIKNPLTPMKLSVQHLEKAWSEQRGNFSERIKKFTKIMIEQIDTLSNIATEFSYFAKMPPPTFEPLDLIGLISSLTGMYSGLENISFEIHTNLADAFISGDKKQISRVFTNLFNNSVHAIGDKKQGKIIVKIIQQTIVYKIRIEDNGTGIPDEFKAKIFLPNFTLKTGGAGLGLAIVREILNGMHGDIEFLPVEEGAVFIITVPVFKTDHNAL